MSIKAIETIYKGYRFRSRNEARWGVFFDAIGLPWDYEIEGFEGDGFKYLPDFYLPSLNIWVEIKLEQSNILRCQLVICGLALRTPWPLMENFRITSFSLLFGCFPQFLMPRSIAMLSSYYIKFGFGFNFPSFLLK